MATVI
jgi:hypothetical protein